ncbi:ASCH domain-containing protein [Horticoccus sp. 23ND18S-11]|uniref:hypothetical protein n=1 Tax=Horticoccus sp. 23ND18S-11 TaxID=3391832 RepID=UPI0039C9CD63
MKVRAISLHQPWASALVLRLKRNETRGWAHTYRGPVAIHASQRDTWREREFWENLSPLSRGALAVAGLDRYESLPRGAIVGIGLPGKPTSTAAMRITELEYTWGNYETGRFAWPWARMVDLEHPIPCRGHQRWWQWEVPTELHSIPAIADLLGPF